MNEYNSGTRFLFACRASRKFCKIHDTETNTETALPRSRGHPDIVLNNDIRKLTIIELISLGGQFNTEERAHGTIHMIFAQTPHEYLLHMYMFHHLLIAIQRFHNRA